MAREITSLQNPHIKEVIKLKNRRQRDRTHCFLVEGYREILRAVEAEVPLVALFYSPADFLGVNEPELINTIQLQGAKIWEVSPNIFQKLSYRDRPDGLLAVARQQPLSLSDFAKTPKKKKDPFFLIAEAIEKPGNLGSILRSCDAASVDALCVCDRCTDIYNPNVVRASIGALFTVPVIEATSEEAIQWLQRNGVQIVAATPEADIEFTKATLLGPIAIVVGTEQLGLTKQWKEASTLKVKIPMYGTIDSLNVAIAATLLLYEVLRQRNE